MDDYLIHGVENRPSAMTKVSFCSTLYLAGIQTEVSILQGVPQALPPLKVASNDASVADALQLGHFKTGVFFGVTKLTTWFLMCGTSIIAGNDSLLGTKWLTWLPWWWLNRSRGQQRTQLLKRFGRRWSQQRCFGGEWCGFCDSPVFFPWMIATYIAMIAILAKSFMFKNTYILGAVSRSKNKSRLRWSKDSEWNNRFVVTYLGSLLTTQVEFSSSLHPRFPWNPLGDLEFFMARWAMLAMWWPAKQLKKLLQLQRKHGRKFNLDWRPVAL